MRLNSEDGQLPTRRERLRTEAARQEVERRNRMAARLRKLRANNRLKYGRVVQCGACGRYHEFKRVSVTFTTPCLKCKSTLTVEGPSSDDERSRLEREVSDLTNALRVSPGHLTGDDSPDLGVDAADVCIQGLDAARGDVH